MMWCSVAGGHLHFQITFRLESVPAERTDIYLAARLRHFRRDKRVQAIDSQAIALSTVCGAAHNSTVVKIRHTPAEWWIMRKPVMGPRRSRRSASPGRLAVGRAAGLRVRERPRIRWRRGAAARCWSRQRGARQYRTHASAVCWLTSLPRSHRRAVAMVS